MAQRPLIFIGNDDGYTAGGIKFLTNIARSYGDVMVCAPTEHQSGKSSAITVDTPLRPYLVSEEAGFTAYKVAGTPVDCAKLAFNGLLPRRPDLVLSGINHGYNAGNSAIYSGTMGVVFEGCFLNIPSIGFSFGDYAPDADFTPCEPIIREMISYTLANGLPDGVCLNINIPRCDRILGTKATIGARGYWTEEFERRIDPHGNPYYWITGKFIAREPDNQLNDLYWLDRGYISITPCHPDQTDTASLPFIRSIIK